MANIFDDILKSLKNFTESQTAKAQETKSKQMQAAQAELNKAVSAQKNPVTVPKQNQMQQAQQDLNKAVDSLRASQNGNSKLVNFMSTLGMAPAEDVKNGKVQQDWLSKNLNKGLDTISSLGSYGSKIGEKVKKANDAYHKETGKDLASVQAVKAVNSFFDKASDYFETNANRINPVQQHHLDTIYAAHVDKDSVINKIQSDPSYGSKITDENGNLIDYSSEIEYLEEKQKNPYTWTKEDHDRLEELKQIQTDQNTLLNSTYYDYLEQNGASQEQLNEFKKSIIQNDYNGIERALTNFGGTVEGYLGNTLKGVDTLQSKVSQLFGIDYDSDNFNEIIDHAEYLQELTKSNAGDIERFIYDVYDGMAPFLYATATSMGIDALGGTTSYIGNEAAAKAMTSRALLMSDVSTLGSTMKKNIDEGYDYDTAFNNAFFHAVLSHLTESIGGEGVANILTGEIGPKLLTNSAAYAIKALSSQFIAEATEEGMEAAIEPLIDKYTLNTGLTVEDYINQVFSKDTAYQMLVGGMGGMASGGIHVVGTIYDFNSQVNTLMDSFSIDTKRDANVAQQVRDNLQSIIDNASSDDPNLSSAMALLKAYDTKIQEYRRKNPYSDAFTTAGDNVTVDLNNSEETIYKAAQPTLSRSMDEIVAQKRYVEEQSQRAVEAQTENLLKNQVTAQTIDTESLSDEALNNVLFAQDIAKQLKRNVSFANLVDKNGNIIDGVHDSNSDTTIVNPNAKEGVLSTLIHEFTHGTESSGFYVILDKLTEEYYGKDFKGKIKEIQDLYSTVAQLDDEGARKELVAKTTQELLSNEDYVDRLVRYNNELAYRLYEEIRYANEVSNGTLSDIEQNFMRAFYDSGNQTQEQSNLELSPQYSTFYDLIKKVKDRSFMKDQGYHTRVEMRSDTPQVLIDNVPNFKNLAMVMDTKHIRAVTGERVNGNNTHYLTDKQLAQIPDKMDNPIAVFKHKTQNSTNMVLDLKDSGGRYVIVAIRPNSHQRYATMDDAGEYVVSVLDTNMIKTTFGLGDNGVDPEAYINDNIEKYYYPEGMTNKKLLQLVEGENLRHAGATSNSKLSISDQNVNNQANREVLNELDAQGIPYTADNDGNITLYHRTSQEAADEILRTGKMKTREDGLFFSTAREGSNNTGYGDTVVELKIPAGLLEVNDLFGDEASMRLPTGNRRNVDVSEYLVKEKTDNAPQFSVSGSETAALHKQRAIDEYGTTFDYRKAAYILDDGRYLDFSYGQNRRVEDHRSISSVYDEDFDSATEYLTSFMNEGNIRVSPESNGIDISSVAEPTKEQYSKMSDYLEHFWKEGYTVDISDENGNSLASLEYPPRTSVRKVISDIKQFYKDGTIPQVTDNGVNEFLQFSISPTLKSELKDIFDNKNVELDNDITVGTTSDFIINDLHAPEDIAKLKTTMNVSKAYQNMVSREKAQADGKYKEKNSYHHLGVDKLYDALVASEDPVAAYVAMNNKTGEPSKNRITIVTDQEIDEKPIIVGMEFKTTGHLDGETLEVNKDITVFGNDKVNNQLKRAAKEGRLLYFNEIKNQPSEGNPRVQFPSVGSPVDYNSNIQNFWDNFKTTREINKPQFSLSDQSSWESKTQSVLDEVNNISGEEELTVEDIDDLLHQRPISQRTLEAIKSAEKTFKENIPLWVPGYDTLRAQYPGFSEDAFNDALYEILSYGEMDPKTRRKLHNNILSEFDFLTPENIDNVNDEVNRELNDFINEAMETFSNETRYKAGEVDTDTVRKAIKVNEAYNGQDIEGEFNKREYGTWINELSSKNKQELQAKYQPLTDSLIDNDNKIRETKGRPSDRKISHLKTFDQNLKALAGGNSEMYNSLREQLRYNLLDRAARKISDTKTRAQTEIIDKVKDLGITQGSKEDIATQWIMEGHTEEWIGDAEGNKNGFKAYGEEDLKKDFDYDMPNGKKAYENILKAANTIRQSYMDLYEEITMTQLIANGDVEGNAEIEIAEAKTRVEQAWNTLKNIKEEIVKNGSKESTQAAYEIQKKKYNTLVTQYNSLVEKNASGDLTRRQLTPFREDYSHHIQKRSLRNTIKGIANSDLAVPTELAGTSDYTNPNTAFSTISMAQDGHKYDPTALGSYAAYVNEAASLIGYNPVILELRQFNKDIKNTAQGTTLNKFSEYLNDYANMLAGKRNAIDRGVQKIVGAKTMKAIQALNSYAKGAALAMNFRSGLVQFANIPNGLGILQERGGASYIGDVAKGIRDYAAAIGKENTPIDQSAFLSNRFFDFDTGEKGFSKKFSDVSGAILTTGDKIGAETIWWSAYEQANRLGEANPILYADDVTRSAIAGRTKEDMSLAAQSQVLNLLFPFQVENVNLFNTLKEQSASKKFGSLMTYSVAAFIFNSIIKGITNGDDEVLPEFITPIYEELRKALNGETDGDDVAQNILLGEVAEFLSLLPAGSSATQLIFGDDSETIFGDYDPNRYGVTNLGVSGIGNLVRDLVEHKDDVRQQAIDVIDNLVSSYVQGGKQLTRTLKGIQSMGGLPDYKNGQIETSPVNYTKSGKVAYVNDQDNIADWIRAGLFGKWSTSEARKYIDSGFKSLSTTAGNVFEALKESGISDFESFTAAQQYQNDKKQAKEDKANGIETDLSLRDQLMENGQYEDFKASIQQAYGDYLKDFDYSEGDPKSFKQFAASYGLDSDDLMNDTYKDFYDTYKLDDKTQKVFQDAMKIENVKNSLGDTINSSGATLRRMAYEEAGIYDDVLKYIEDNGLEYSDFGLNKTVVGYNSTKMSNMLAKINKVTGSNYTYNGKKVYSGSRSSGSSRSRKRSGSSGLTKAQKRAMINIVKSLGTGSSSNVFSALDNILSTATSIEDVKKKVKAVQKKYS